MTEEQVVNVSGEEGNSGDDHRGVNAKGVAHTVDGDVDLASGGASSEKLAVKNCKDAEANGTAEEASEEDGELKRVYSEGGAGSVRNGVVENETPAAAADELIADHEEYVVVGASDVQNSVAAEGEIVGDANGNVNEVEECELLDRAEVSGDENGVVVNVVEGDTDVNQGDRDFECVEVHNDVAMVDGAEEEVTAAADANGGDDVQSKSEPISDKDVEESGEIENVVSADVSDEKDIVTNENHDVEEVTERNEVPVDVGGVSGTTDVKEYEPEDARNSSETGQIESASGLAESEHEPSECTEENEIVVEGESGSKSERSEQEAGSELVNKGESTTALNITDVNGDGDVVSHIAVESTSESSVNVCKMKSNAVDCDGELNVHVQEMKNAAVDSEAGTSNGAVQNESTPSAESEMENSIEEVEAEPSNFAVEGEAKPSNGAAEREVEPSNGAVEREVEPSNGVVESRTGPSNGEFESVPEPSNGALESVAESSNGAVEDEADSSNGAVVTEIKTLNGAVEIVAEPSNGAVEFVAVPSNGAIEGEVEPSNEEVVSEADLSNGAVESVTGPSNGAVEVEAESSAVNEAEPSNGAVEPSNGEVEGEVEPSSGAVESQTEPSNGAVEREAEPSNGEMESEAEPSDREVEREAESSDGAVEREAEPSDGVAEREAEPSNGEVEREAEPSDGAVERELEPSNGVLEREAEPSNGAVKRESEPSNGSFEREAKPSDDVVESEVEPSNGEVESEVKLSNGIVEGEAEPSNEVESEAKPSNDVVESEAKPSDIVVESEAKPSEGVVESEAKPLNSILESEAKPSNGVVESESESSVDLREMKNNAVNSEAELSTGALKSETESSAVSDIKRYPLEIEDEHSKGAVEGEAQPVVEGEGSNQGDEDTRPALDASDVQNVGAEIVKKPFFYLIRVPRYDDDENIKEQIEKTLRQVEEKTKIRDSIRAESQTIKARCKDCDQEVKAAIAAHRAARDQLKSKRQEMDSVQSKMNRLNNAISVGDIDGKIRNMEHMIQHETLPLNEEKQLIRQIKQLKQNREELSSNMRKQDQSQQSLDHKEGNIEEHSKHLQLLKKEMEVLRNNVLKLDAATKDAKKKYNNEYDKLNELIAQFKAADEVRQEAYAKSVTLKKQLHEKGKHFWDYRKAANKAQELAAGGKKEELQCFCVDQVERIMELWNKNDDFRRDYVRCNTRSTLRRLQTLDGRSLGPDEEPPVIPNVITVRASKNISVVSQSTLEQEKKPPSTESVIIKEEPVSKVVVQKTETSQTTKAKNPTKPSPLEKTVARWGDESDEEVKNEEPVRTKEEEELLLKAEKAKKEEEEAMLKEKRRLEEIEKAKEAQQRKKRNAEKAQQRAALKAQKEAEQKEKEREKRARKKERRKAASAVTADNIEQESAPTSEILTRSLEEHDQSEKPTELTKKPQKPSQFTKQTKPKSVPLALRNRGKRRIQPWMWVLIAVIVAAALFYVGNSSVLRSSLQGFGF
ncbi:plectin [Vigna radiata var. radiata]|uniref:Plectin n=1 Tax=Vigna radiata var. radiata TaxID=3916 RepID=A0A1S3VQT0_VIGRR|nr:plectin [Vigna radiata var. radiata]